MQLSSFDLHLEQESKLNYINPETGGNDRLDDKITLTYEQALYQIYLLSFDIKYEKYLHKESNDGNNRILGASIDKKLGHIYLILQKTNESASVIQWSSNKQWQEIDTSLSKVTSNNSNTFTSQFHVLILKKKEFESNENEISLDDDESYFLYRSNRYKKLFLPIERTDWPNIEEEKNAEKGLYFTISYNDIFSYGPKKVKNAYYL